MRLLPLLVLVACTTRSHGGLDVPACISTPSAVDSADATALGYSADDLIAQLGTATTQTLTWVGDESETTLTVELTGGAGDVRFIDNEVESGGDPASCEDSLEVDTNVAISTADGVFAETWAVTLHAYTVDSASFTQDLDAAALIGTFDKWDYADATADYESLGAEMSVSLVPDGGSGEVTLKGSGWEDADCRSDGCVAWDSRETAATWGGGT
ncbi:MAG: hypothetical protein V4850_19220 [Myxococcota bacterium]